MNTFQLECFLAVANTLSFARAAEELNVSQPTVTHQIKSLEDELNAKLFIRSTRMVEITPEGQSFITDAKSMIMIAKLPRSNTLFQSPGLTGSAVFVGTADVKRLISPETAETGKDIGGKDLCQISEMRDVVHIRKCGSDESFFHKSTLLKNSYQNKVLPSFMQGNDQTFWFSALPRVTLWNTFTVYL